MQKLCSFIIKQDYGHQGDFNPNIHDSDTVLCTILLLKFNYNKKTPSWQFHSFKFLNSLDCNILIISKHYCATQSTVKKIWTLRGTEYTLGNLYFMCKSLLANSRDSDTPALPVFILTVTKQNCGSVSTKSSGWQKIEKIK